MPTETAKVRRIVMALDTASSILPAIETAAGLALVLKAELAGFFIEDERLLRFAGLPFAREFGFVSAGSRPMATAAVERALRAQAAQLRRLLAETAQRLSIDWTLEVVRGQVPRSVVVRASAADLLVLGRSEYTWPEVTPRVDPARRFPSLAARPAAVVFDDAPAALRALVIGSTLAEVTGSELIVLIVAVGLEGFKALRLQAAQHLAGRIAAHYLHLPGSKAGSIIRTARSRHFGVLLWPGSVEDFTPAQLSELPCPVVVLN